MSWLCGRACRQINQINNEIFAGVGHWPAESRDAETVLQNVCYLRPLGLNKSNMYSSTQIRRCVGRYCDDDVIISRPTAFGAMQSWKKIDGFWPQQQQNSGSRRASKPQAAGRPLADPAPSGILSITVFWWILSAILASTSVRRPHFEMGSSIGKLFFWHCKKTPKF